MYITWLDEYYLFHKHLILFVKHEKLNFPLPIVSTLSENSFLLVLNPSHHAPSLREKNKINFYFHTSL